MIVWPKLSDKAEEYMNDPNRVYPVPDSIRIEVEKYLEDTEPLLKIEFDNMVKMFDNIFKENK